MNRRLHRRSVLRGAAGIAMGLPFLDAMLPRHARAQAATPPLRFGVFFTPNGVIEQDWAPKGGERDFTLSTTLAPLAPHRDDIVIVHGLNAETTALQGSIAQGPESENARFNPHDVAMTHMLTAARVLGTDFGRANHLMDGTAGGPSIDQAIAKVIGNDTLRRSLELGVQSTITNLEPLVLRMSYADSHQPRDPIDDPRLVFERMFGDTSASQAEIEALHRRRRSVLDAVLGEFNSVSSVAGYDDRQRLEQHATNIRDLERQLDVVRANSLACTTPSSPPDVVSGFPALGKVQMDLMVLALACSNITRVASLQWSTAESQTVHSHLGLTEAHHQMSHDVVNSAPMLTKINTWYAEQFAYLLGEMKKIKEGEGTLLDNTLLFWPNELSQGEVHDYRNMPYVLAGKASGKLATGRYLQYKGEPHNRLYTTFLNMFGIEATGFGESSDPRFSGVLTGLV